MTFDQVYAAYREQVLALHEGGVDLFLVETIFDTLNAKAALKAILDLEDDGLEPLPIWISGTITDRSGRTPGPEILDLAVGQSRIGSSGGRSRRHLRSRLRPRADSGARQQDRRREHHTRAAERDNNLPIPKHEAATPTGS